MPSRRGITAVAWVARELGIPATVFLPRTVPEEKVEGIRSLNAAIVLTRGGHQASIDQALSWAADRDMAFIPPFDHPDVIAGQGTVALELLEQWPRVDTVVVPLSGGGLMSGIALVVRRLAPEIHLVGVSMSAGAAMIDSLEAGAMVEVEETPTLADALAGALPLDNRYTFPICRDLVDETARVDEAAIRRALAWSLDREGLMIEGGAAVGIAWLLDAGGGDAARRVAVVVTGDSIDRDRLRAAIAGSTSSR